MYKLKSKVMLALLVTSTIIGSSAFSNYNAVKSGDVPAGNNGQKLVKSVTEKDTEFLVKASEIIMQEIKLGKLAQEKGRMSHVKDLGKKMEVDHTKSLMDLKALAKSKNISLPTSTTDNANDEYKNLEEKSGNDFDKAYIEIMVDEHKDAIELFEKASTDSDDFDIKNWALTTLPTLRIHHDHSKVCQKELDKM